MLNRRDFLRTTSVGLGAWGVGAATIGAKEAPPGSEVQRRPDEIHSAGLPNGWRTMRKLDAHNHVMSAVHRPETGWAEVDTLIETADRLGISQLICSRPVMAGVMANIDTVRDANASILAAMRRHPGRILGYCFVQPGNGAAALDEIDRCLDAGMVGVKLYNQYFYNDPVVFPIAERCIERKILFLGHSAHLTDPRTRAAQPKTSDSKVFCELSQRYPELMLILGHINGGGDWEWSIKALRNCPNVYLDTSGSVLENPTIERCVKELGHKRVLFATDMTMEGGVGKLLSAQITAEQREDIFWRNLQGLLDRRRA